MRSGIDFARSEPLDAFLAVQREAFGVVPGDPAYLKRPLSPAVEDLCGQVRAWSKGKEPWVPAFLAVARPERGDDASKPLDGSDAERAVENALKAARLELAPTLRAFDPVVRQAQLDLSAVEWVPVIQHLVDAFGVTPTALPRVFLVPLAPHYPGSGLLMERGRPTGSYVDCDRFRGTTLVDAVVALTVWLLLFGGPDDVFLNKLKRLLPAGTRSNGHLRSLILKVIVELTAAHETTILFPLHRGSIDLLGTQWRLPRLCALVEREWIPVLRGERSPDQALMSISGEVESLGGDWYTEEVEASALASDFYILGYLASSGDSLAEATYDAWLGPLARYLFEHLGLVIGGELGHYAEMPPDDAHLRKVRWFAEIVNRGDSRVGWHDARVEMGDIEALTCAAMCFEGLGDSYGGHAWHPVAQLLQMFASGAIHEPVFIDQCFTLQHHNGPLFDKYLNVDDLGQVLAFQAGGDLFGLSQYCSEEVRQMLVSHALSAGALGCSPGGAERGAILQSSVRQALWELGACVPGMVGCGSPRGTAGLWDH